MIQYCNKLEVHLYHLNSSNSNLPKQIISNHHHNSNNKIIISIHKWCNNNINHHNQFLVQRNYGRDHHGVEILLIDMDHNLWIHRTEESNKTWPININSESPVCWLVSQWASISANKLILTRKMPINMWWGIWQWALLVGRNIDLCLYFVEKRQMWGRIVQKIPLLFQQFWTWKFWCCGHIN